MDKKKSPRDQQASALLHASAENRTGKKDSRNTEDIKRRKIHWEEFALILEEHFHTYAIQEE